MEPLLEVRDLEVGYGGSKVLHRLSFKMKEGQRIGFFGPNGHGKSTLLRTISGLLSPWGGEILLRGQAIGGTSPRSIVNQGIIHVPQGNILFPEMTVEENLRVGGYSVRARKKIKVNLENVYQIFPRLAQRHNQVCKTLSGGERQMVAIGIGVMCEPHLLMLDESTLGLAPKIKDEVCVAIKRISDSGVPLLIVEQDLDFLIYLTEKLHMINHGKVELEFDVSQRLNHEEIMKMYFGEGAS